MHQHKINKNMNKLETFKQQLKVLIVQSMRDKAKLELETYRSISNAITVLEKNNPGKEINHIDVLLSLKKQRTQSIDAYTAGGNIEAAETEQKELTIIESLLPKFLTESETVEILTNILAGMENPTKRDMGKIINTFKEENPGQDMSMVSKYLNTVL
jgi:uncharacterized protein YqeY